MDDEKIIHDEEIKLIREIESEKKFMTLRKLFKIFELNALLHN